MTSHRTGTRSIRPSTAVTPVTFTCDLILFLFLLLLQMLPVGLPAVLYVLGAVLGLAGAADEVRLFALLFYNFPKFPCGYIPMFPGFNSPLGSGAFQ